jgi:hypothetical protein
MAWFGMPTPVRPRHFRWLRAADPSQIAGYAVSGRGNSLDRRTRSEAAPGMNPVSRQRCVHRWRTHRVL